ncbi:substrate-binding domain-containing protein [bacterium]|nr:substrate-binding domain-containing protein [bacterium]
MIRYVMVSLMAIVISLGMIGLSRNLTGRHDSLVVLCAPSLAGPMEELKEAFVNSQRDSGSEVSIDIMYRGSAELLALYRMSHIGDVLVAADAVYHQPFVEAEVCDVPVTLGRQFPCLIYTQISKREALAILSGEVSPSISTSIPKPEHAAIGRAVAEIVGHDKYRDLILRAKVTRETVTQVAADVSSGIVDVGIAWTTTPRQFGNLKSVVVAGWEKHSSQIGASVFLESKNLSTANRFRDFLRSPEGRKVFREYQFSTKSAADEIASLTELQ